MVTKKMCNTNKNVTKMGMIIKGFTAPTLPARDFSHFFHAFLALHKYSLLQYNGKFGTNYINSEMLKSSRNV
jgi:hypothetical protein